MTTAEKRAEDSITRVTKTATMPQTNYRPALFYQSAREGMRDFLTHALRSPGDGVLLPAYIGWSPREGSGVFDPVLTIGARAGFYDLNPDLTVDVESLEKRLEIEHFRVLVVIHYFGRTDPNGKVLRALADRHGMLLVEDLAHGFYSAVSGMQAGRHGHVSLFSLHKMLPLHGGGMLTYADPTLVLGQKSTRPELAGSVMSYDWAAIAQARRDNYQELAYRLCGMAEFGLLFDLMWPRLSSTDVPQTLPVRVLGQNRDAIYSGMNEDGYGMVSLYHTLIEQVREGFAGLNEISRHIINFPIHQDVNIADLDGMVNSFRTHLHSESGQDA